MCIMCDGYSFEDAMRGVELSIRVHGWHLTAVEEPLPWYYTIGLTETHHHPELVVVDLNMVAGQRLIRWAVGLIESHGRLDPDELATRGVDVVVVHERHLAGDWFGTWSNHYGTTPPPGSFVQIIPPPDWFCDCHRLHTRRLDQQDVQPLANRATRRRQQRSRRR